MKLIWKGRFSHFEQLNQGQLPANAIRYEEPEDLTKLNREALKFLIPPLLLTLISMGLRKAIHGSFDFQGIYLLIGTVAGFLTILPHELMHALCFPRRAPVEMWYSFKFAMVFVHSTFPVSKKRFIWISLCPNFIFGALPMILWVILPSGYVAFRSVMFSFAAICLVLGVGDYLNVYNTLKQVPDGAYTQLSGFHSYWFMPANKD